MKYRAFVGSLAVVVGCATGAGPPAPLGVAPPPRLPGSSITHTKLCECTACSPASCCVDEGLSAPEGDVYGLAVTSCAPRCGKYAFRVALVDDCDARRPAACCSG